MGKWHVSYYFNIIIRVHIMYICMYVCVYFGLISNIGKKRRRPIIFQASTREPSHHLACSKKR